MFENVGTVQNEAGKTKNNMSDFKGFKMFVCLRLYILVNNFSVILGCLPGFNQYQATVEETAGSAAWLTFSSLQQFVTKFSISCPIGQ